MPIKVTTKCRICGNPDLKPILELGHQPLSGVFPRPEAPDPSVSPLELIRCNKESKPDACGLVQLRHQAELSEMYGTTYGYFSSISPTMVLHLEEKVRRLKAFANLVKGDVVLDPFNGAGTTTAVSKKLNRRYLGIDNSKDYCKKAENRIREILL